MSEASINNQLEMLETNIEDLNDIILELIKKEEPYKFKIKWLTKRQIAKKILENASPNKDEETKKSIHMLVYGKYLVEDGKLIDNEEQRPDCVERRRDKKVRKAMDDNHTILKDQTKKLKRELKNAGAVLNAKYSEIKTAIKNFNIQLTTATAAIASSSAILPPGSGVPVAITAAQNIVTAFFSLIGKVAEILPILGPLLTIPLLVAAEVLESLLIAANGILMLLNTILTALAAIKKPIAKLAGTVKMA